MLLGVTSQLYLNKTNSNFKIICSETEPTFQRNKLAH